VEESAEFAVLIQDPPGGALDFRGSFNANLFAASDFGFELLEVFFATST